MTDRKTIDIIVSTLKKTQKDNKMNKQQKLDVLCEVQGVGPALATLIIEKNFNIKNISSQYGIGRKKLAIVKAAIKYYQAKIKPKTIQPAKNSQKKQQQKRVASPKKQQKRVTSPTTPQIKGGTQATQKGGEPYKPPLKLIN